MITGRCEDVILDWHVGANSILERKVFKWHIHIFVLIDCTGGRDSGKNIINNTHCMYDCGNFWWTDFVEIWSSSKKRV